jgi:hypothetical protein
LVVEVQYNSQGALEGSDRTYTLQLVNVPNLDPFFDRASFSFLETASSNTAPQSPPLASLEPIPIEEIDYLAKDYSSFRQLMLNRLSLVMPQWQESNPADLGIALVEILAYAADRLSYYQDAVATEAYLGTARRRISVRRHARLVDYAMHEGCNARVWVQVQVNADNLLLPQGTMLLTQITGEKTLVAPSDRDRVLSQQPKVFETMHSAKLFEAHNEIYFYTWGAEEFFLHKGATRATLTGKFSNLQAGDVLIFEEVREPETGLEENANPHHRHAVRLTGVTATEDPLGGQFQDPPNNNSVCVTEIEWHLQDALPFPLWISTQNSAGANISIARGNIVLADCGQRIKEEALPPVPVKGCYRPDLQRSNLTHSVPYGVHPAQTMSAAKAIAQEPKVAVPSLSLYCKETDETWFPQRDLLNSDQFAADFVVETESDGSAYLRFGDGAMGKQPTVNSQMQATYRIGNGLEGNVGAEAIAHLIPLDENSYADLAKKVSLVRNPLPAKGGIDPEPIEQVRRDAPQAFYTPESCVTEADCATLLQRHPEVKSVAAHWRWTGSWYTMFVAVDRHGDQQVDAEFKAELLAFLEPFRLIGCDFEIQAPRFVPLDIALTVQVQPDCFANTVKQALIQTFSNADLPDGQRGFFHPENFTFGKPVYLSQVVSRAMQVSGIAWVDITCFGRRWTQDDPGKLPAEQIAIAPLEIARLDNHPDRPENGKISFDMKGGL